jgi:excinuclease UvrABC nuclease subunit
MLELDCGLAYDSSRSKDFCASLPPLPAIVKIEPRAELANSRAYLIRTGNLRLRMERLLGPRDPSDAAAAKRLDLRNIAARICYRLAGSPFELAFVHWQQARQIDPQNYRDRLRMRSPALIKMTVGNAYPRCLVTRIIRANDEGKITGGLYFGPMSSRRAADAFASEFLNLFKIRRCQIKIRRDPSFPGCIYSEMKMCMAPCFAGCTDEEYAGESARVENFLKTCGASLEAEVESEREAASAAEEFEKAAALHKRLDKIADVLRGVPEIARPINQLDAVVLQRAAGPDAIAVFVVRSGWIEQPFLLRFNQTADPRSAEEVLREQLGAEKGDSTPSASENQISGAHSREERGPLADHLALLSRWFYSKPRAGEIFFREKDWPYRKLIRACARLLQPAS